MEFDWGSYLVSALWDGLRLLAAGLLPVLAAAFVMQKFSDLLRNKLAAALGIKTYIYLTAAGVMVHELSHAFSCIIFRHKMIEMKLFAPEADGTLGYVNHAYNPKSLYQRIGNFFIGTGPVWGGCFMLALISRLLLPEFMLQGYSLRECFAAFTDGLFTLEFYLRWQSWLWLYLTLTVASHITLSPPDLKGAADGLLMIVLVVLLSNLLLGWAGNWTEYIWQYEIALLVKMFIALIGALFTGTCIIIILHFTAKRRK